MILDFAISALAVIGALSIAFSLAVLGVLIFITPRPPCNELHPETQDDFAVSLKRWADMQERMK